MNLALSFARSADKSGEKPAVFWGDHEFSYSQLRLQSLALARLLQNDFGIEPGDRVGLWLRNCPEFVPSIYGIFEAGAVAVPINNFLKPREVAFILNDAGSTVLITDAALTQGAAELRAIVPHLRVFQVEEFSNTERFPGAKLRPVERTEADLAVIIYTSGTTGRPKGAMLSHGNLLHNVESCRQMLKAVSFDRMVVLLPMFHSFMLTVGVLLTLTVGGSIVLVRSLHPAKNILQEIVHRQATILPAIPQFFRALVNAPVPANMPLRICVSGAAPLPVEVLKEFNQKFPIPLIEGYGLSEASPVVSMNPIHGPWKAGSIGVPVPDVEMAVQNDVGEFLSHGQIGEICVRGGNVMQGYWNQPAETAKAIRDGWLLTGDIGYRDSDGYYYITDRKKDMLLVNGINVYPREIEEIIYQIAGIKEAAVIGVPDQRKGEHPVAFVAANDGVILDEKAILQFVRDKLADYKVPRRVIFVPNLPRNATGKILKTTLREMAAAGVRA